MSINEAIRQEIEAARLKLRRAKTYAIGYMQGILFVAKVYARRMFK